jgi:hypothetical protein
MRMPAIPPPPFPFALTLQGGASASVAWHSPTLRPSVPIRPHCFTRSVQPNKSRCTSSALKARHAPGQVDPAKLAW